MAKQKLPGLKELAQESDRLYDRARRLKGRLQRLYLSEKYPSDGDVRGELGRCVDSATGGLTDEALGALGDLDRAIVAAYGYERLE